MSMSFWTLLNDFCDQQDRTEAWVLRRAVLGKGTFSAWRARGIPALPEHSAIVGLADAMNLSYWDVLEAVLHDTLYLPEINARAVQGTNSEAEQERWNSVGARILELRRQAKDDDRLAVALGEALRATPGSDPKGITLQAVLVLQGKAHLPDWLDLDDLSVPDDLVGDLVAAHDEVGPISGEQGAPDTA